MTGKCIGRAGARVGGSREENVNRNRKWCVSAISRHVLSPQSYKFFSENRQSRDSRSAFPPLTTRGSTSSPTTQLLPSFAFIPLPASKTMTNNTADQLNNESSSIVIDYAIVNQCHSILCKITACHHTASVSSIPCSQGTPLILFFSLTAPSDV